MGKVGERILTTLRPTITHRNGLFKKVLTARKKMNIRSVPLGTTKSQSRHSSLFLLFDFFYAVESTRLKRKKKRLNCHSSILLSMKRSVLASFCSSASINVHLGLSSIHVEDCCRRIDSMQRKLSQMVISISL